MFFESESVYEKEEKCKSHELWWSNERVKKKIKEKLELNEKCHSVELGVEKENHFV